MKRVISVILTLSMLLSLVAGALVFTSSAAEAEYEHTLADYNVGTKAYKFDGTVKYIAFSGPGTQAKAPYYWANEHYKYPLPEAIVKEGTSGDVLLINGVIDDGEWGSPSLSISSKDAVVYQKDKGTDYNYAYPNAENTMFTYINNLAGLNVKDGKVIDENGEETGLYYEGLKYDVYFMWDNDYLYVGARVYDPDGHKNSGAYATDVDNWNTAGKDTWNGDAFQFRIDGQGPNSVTNGGNYDASQLSPYSSYFENGAVAEGSRLPAGEFSGDYDPLTMTAAEKGYTYPWASSGKMFSEEKLTDVCNITVAYSTFQSGFTSVHDSAKRYNPHDFAHTDGDKTLMTYTAYDGASLSFFNGASYAAPGWALMLEGKMDRVWATVTPQGQGFQYDPDDRVATSGSRAGYGKNTYNHATTDYEIALPWSYVNLEAGTEIAPGLELGVALGLLNAKAGASEYNSTLEWGNGIFNDRMSAMPQTCGGSNSLILSETSYKDHVACEHTFADPTCEQPYTCTKCGYQKGYKSGHKYATYEQVLPTEGTAGYTKAECSVCHDKVTRELANVRTDVKHKFERTETTHDNIYDNWSVGYSSLWLNREYILDENGNVAPKQTTDAQGNAVDAGTQIKTVEDNKIKMSFWAAGAKKPYCSMTKDNTDLITNPFRFAVLDCTSVDQTGSYFLQSTGSPSYTYKMDIYLEGVYDVDWPESRKETVNDVNYGESGYLDQFFFWFGGENETDYQAGLYEVKGDWYFAIIKNSSKMDRKYINEDMIDDETPSGKDGLAEFKRQAIVCVEADIAFQQWHEMVFFYDKDAQVASLYWDDELVVGAYDEGFYSPKTGTEGNSMFRPFNIQFYMTDIEIGTTSLASKYVETSAPTPPPAAEKYEVTVNGAVIGEYEAGETVTVTADVAEGYQFEGWTGDVQFADATAATTTFTMPANAVAVSYTTSKIPAPKYAVTVNGAVIGEFEEGETVTVTADVAEGYRFCGWNGDVEFADATATTTTFTMPAKAVEVAYTTTKIPAPKYAVTVNGEVIGEFEEGQTVTVTATVANGYKFNGWNGDVEFADATATTTTFTMPAKAVAVAYTTSVIKYTVTVNGAVLGEYVPGETVSVTATVADGYVFDGWTSATGVQFADAKATTTTFTMPAGDVYVTYTTSKAPVEGDVDGDGKLNVSDIFALKTALVGRADYDAKYDIDGNGRVNLVDMYRLKALFI